MIQTKPDKAANHAVVILFARKPSSKAESKVATTTTHFNQTAEDRGAARMCQLPLCFPFSSTPSSSSNWS